MRMFTCTVVLAALSISLGAQSAPAGAPSAAAPAPADYAYRPDGRRDPFTSLVNSGTDARVPGARAEGLAGFAVGEISVRGIMQSRGLLVAMVHGPDDKTYVIHQGDKFADGVVKNVTPQGLVVVQDVSDPLSVQKHREVRKLLRSLEDAK
jgi:Tfp pilus assembly protein PilP